MKITSEETKLERDINRHLAFAEYYEAMEADTLASSAQSYYKDEAIRHLETANQLNEELRLIVNKNRILGEVLLQNFLN